MVNKAIYTFLLGLILIGSSLQATQQAQDTCPFLERTEAGKLIKLLDAGQVKEAYDMIAEDPEIADKASIIAGTHCETQLALALQDLKNLYLKHVRAKIACVAAGALTVALFWAAHEAGKAHA